jgi:type I restriction enzyme S subunit
MPSVASEKLRLQLEKVVPPEWRVMSIKQVARLGSGTTPSRANPGHYRNGTIPWVKTGDLNNATITRTEELITEAALRECGCTLYPRHTVLIAMYGGFRQIGRTGLLINPATTNQALTAIQPNEETVIAEFVQEWLNHKVEFWRAIAASSRKDPNITKADIAEFPIPIPSLPSQRSIVRFGTAWERAIRDTENLVERKECLLAGFSQQLLTGETRIRGINASWRETHLRDVTDESTSRYESSRHPASVMAVNKNLGLIPMRQRVVADSLKRYKVLPPKAFAYNPMRLNIGSIAMSQFDSQVLVSPDYVVFSCDQERLDPEYLNFIRRTHEWSQYVSAAGNGSVRVRIYYDDLGALRLKLPDIEEQRRISRILAKCEKEICLLRRQAELYRQQKRWLMNELLMGRVRPLESSPDPYATQGFSTVIEQRNSVQK